MNDLHSPTAGLRPDYLRPDKVSYKRALAMYATGVVIGLILGGIGLFNARGTVTNRVPEEDLALVNQQPILRSDFVTQLEAETGKPFEQSSREDQLRVLDEMLREELFVQRGLELNFAETDQNTRYALYDIVEQQIVAGVATGKATDEQLRAYYEEHRDKYKSNGKLDVHHLLVESGSAAQGKQAAQALRDGTDLDVVKQRYGLTEAEYNADEYYYMANYHLGDDLFSLVTDAKPGDVVGPVKTDDGLHILQVVGNTLPVPLTFEQAYSDVQTDHYNDQKAQRMNSMMEFLRNRSTILIADDYRDDYNPADFENTD